MITVHCDYTDDAKMLTASFMLPEPLPVAETVNGEFLLGLHEWLENKRAEPPKLFASDSEALH